MSRPHPSTPFVLSALLLTLLALGCENGGSLDLPTPPVVPSTPTTTGGQTPTPTPTPPVPRCGNGSLESGERCDDGNLVAGDGCSATCTVEVTSTGPLSVQNVQSAADASEGARIGLSNYRVPADGLLLVRIGAKGSVSQSVRFGGEEMIHAASTDVTYFATISVEMFYLPVRAGQSGAIQVDYGFDGTDAKGLIASTLVGVDRIARVQTLTDGAVEQDGRTGPNLAQYAMRTTGDGVVVSAFTDFGSGIPEAVGSGHALDGYPTVPESVFHELKVMGGHVIAPAAGDYTLGFRNTNPAGFMDYAMIVATFAR